MALFFDQEWFDARLSERGLNKIALGAVLGLGIEEIDAMWKDQREISPREVTLLAELLGATTREISKRGGAATPLPKAADDTGAVLARLDARLQNLERGQADILALLVSLSEKMPGD